LFGYGKTLQRSINCPSKQYLSLPEKRKKVPSSDVEGVTRRDGMLEIKKLGPPPLSLLSGVAAPSFTKEFMQYGNT
jgi:hypothetical protein